MSNKSLKRKKALVSFFLLIGMFVFSQSTIDLSEKMMKIKGQYPNSFGDKGFGFYDWGEKKYKILNWNFEIEKSFPITLGEGPGEIKPYVYNAFIYNDRVYVNGHLSKSISIYSYKGKFLNSIPLGIQPRHILLHEKNIYVFNSAIIDVTGLPLAQIINIDTGKQLKEIHLKSSLPKPKDFGDDISMYFIHFDISGDRLIYMLHSLDNSFLIIDENGNITKKVELPHKSRVTYSAHQEGKNVLVRLNTYDFYNDIKCTKDGVYVTFMRTVKIVKATKEIVFKTHLVRWSKDSTFSEKVFNGSLIILGEHMDILYLFNRKEYTVLPVNKFHFETDD